MTDKQKPEVDVPAEQTLVRGNQPGQPPAELQNQSREVVPMSDAQIVEAKMDDLARKAFSGEITPEEMGALQSHLLDEALDGVEFVQSLGITDCKEIMQFITLRNQAIKDLGVDTVYARTINDLFLGTAHQYKGIMRHAATIEKLVGICSERYAKTADTGSLAETVRDLNRLHENVGNLQSRALRNLCTLARVQNGICRTYANATMKINAQTVNLGNKQINVEINGQTGVVRGSIIDAQNVDPVIDVEPPVP